MQIKQDFIHASDIDPHGAVELTRTAEGAYVLDGQELPTESVDYLVWHGLKISLAHSIANKETYEDRNKAFGARKAKIIAGSMGVTTKRGGKKRSAHEVAVDTELEIIVRAQMQGAPAKKIKATMQQIRYEASQGNKIAKNVIATAVKNANERLEDAKKGPQKLF